MQTWVLIRMQTWVLIRMQTWILTECYLIHFSSISKVILYQIIKI